jgi:hypothetical protein
VIQKGQGKTVGSESAGQEQGQGAGIRPAGKADKKSAFGRNRMKLKKLI